jgi:SAM-dependent methyltransferase
MTLIEPDRPAEKETLVAPYDALAPHYEAFMGDASESDAWHRRLLALIAEHGVTSGRALDVGCGTGRSLESFRDAGFAVAGSDPSAGMLAIARDRLGTDVPLEVAALPELGPGPRVALITAVNDVVNYVAPADLDAAMRALAGRLAPGGLLLFDANTPLIYREFFTATSCRSTPGRFFVWQGLESEEHAGGSATHRADLHTFAADAGDPEARWRHSVSHQVQHHHPHARVASALTGAGLTLLAAHGQRPGAPTDPTCDEAIHTKRIYLARLP